MGTLPDYLSLALRKNSNARSRITRNSGVNLLCPLSQKQLEGGRTFAVKTQRKNCKGLELFASLTKDKEVFEILYG